MKLQTPRIDVFFLLLLVLVISTSVPVYIGSVKVEEHVQRRMISDMVSVVGHTFSNVEALIRAKVGSRDIVTAFYQSRELRKSVEDILSLLVTPEIKYVYIVYRDKEGKFRFLADGSKEDRAEIGEKLDVLHEDRWLEALREKKNVVIIQTNLHTIGATYLKPIVQGGEARALLVADISVQKIREVRSSLNLIRQLSTGSIIASLFFLYMALYQYLKKRKLLRELYTDRLTGLFNRNYLSEAGPGLDISRYYLALMDIDDFRKVNATYGEEAGDAVLRELADFLRRNIKRAILIRYAGEEFMVLVPKEMFRNKTQVIEFFEDIKDRIKKHTVRYGGNEIRVRISIGLNISTGRERSLEETIKNADRALYRAKREGKDRVEAYDESVEQLKRKLSVGEVTEAIDGGRILCHYQPVVDLQSGRVIHYEALARIRGEEGEIYTPAFFLEDIKGTFIYTRFVREIIALNVKLLREREDLKISINLAPTDVTDESVFEALLGVEKDIRKRMLLEITEVEGIPSFEGVKSALGELRKLGYRICIDDFGAGYSNLVNLTQMRIDYLKIDGSIIRDIHRNKMSRLLTEMVTRFCREVGIKVVGEFVENERIAEELRKVGVHYGQGYHLGKPGPL